MSMIETASSTGICQCEHQDHERGGTHRPLSVPANPRRVAMYVGAICDECADGHMSGYLRVCRQCGSGEHWTEDHHEAGA